MKNNRIGDNPALAAILKTVKTNEKEYKTTQLQPKKKKIAKHNLANFELDRSEREYLVKKEIGTEDRPIGLATKNNNVLVNYYKTENKILAYKINELTTVIVRAVEDLNHLIEAKEIEKSIIKEMKEGIYSRWKQL